MAIVHVVDRVKAGHGRGLSALSIARAQYRSGWKVKLLVSGVRSPELLPKDLPWEPLFADYHTEVYRDVDAIDRVTSALGRTTIPSDIIVCHEGVDLVAACRLGCRKVVAAVHSNPQQCLEYLSSADVRAVVRRADHWIVWGGIVAARIRRLGVAWSRITVSAQSVEPLAPKRGTRPMAGSPACLTAARLHPVKNHGVMLEALAILAERQPGVHWHMAGDCEQVEYRRGLRLLASRLGVEDHVTWHGHRDDVAALMLGCNVIVLASHSEGVPRAIQEAMVLGVPTVMPAQLAPELNHAGLPVRYWPNSPDALAAAIEAAIAVPSVRRSAAASWVRETWGWDKVLRDWEDALVDRNPVL